MAPNILKQFGQLRARLAESLNKSGFSELLNPVKLFPSTLKVWSPTACFIKHSVDESLDSARLLNTESPAAGNFPRSASEMQAVLYYQSLLVSDGCSVWQLLSRY